MSSHQYESVEWFVAREDMERLREYARQHELRTPADVMHHLLERVDQGADAHTRPSVRIPPIRFKDEHGAPAGY